MTSPQLTVTKSRHVCFCYHCKKGGFKRTELNAWFLCPECAAQPGSYVKGYVKPSERGLASGASDYWNATKHQLCVITDDEGTSGAAPPALSPPQSNEFQHWQADVLADTRLLPDEKLYLLMLAKFADYRTGANCFPRYQEQADALGLTTRQVRRLRHIAIADGWVKVWRMSAGWRRTSDLLQFCRPKCAKHGVWEGPISYTRRKGAMLITPEKARE